MSDERELDYPALGDFLRASLHPGADGRAEAWRLRSQIEATGGTPWLQPDGQEVAFLYFEEPGELPDTKGEPKVLLTSNFTHWTTRKDRGAVPLLEIPGTGVHFRLIRLPSAGRIHYKLLVADHVHPADEPAQRNAYFSNLRISDKLILDPLNPRRSIEGRGPHSVYEMPGFAEPAILRERPDAVPEDRLRTLEWRSERLGNERKVVVYLPPGFEEGAGERYPLLLVQDGNVYGNRLHGLPRTLEALIARSSMRPVLAALVAHVDREAEFRKQDEYYQVLMAELLPRLRDELPLADEAGVHAAMGVSHGALFSCFLCGLHPEIFGRGVFHAGAYVGPAMREMAERTRSGELRFPGRYYMDCGTFDFYYPQYLVMRSVFEGLGIQARFGEYAEGHEWSAWISRDANALPYIYPPE